MEDTHHNHAHTDASHDHAHGHTHDHTHEHHDHTDHKHNTLMAICAYLGPLVIISYLTLKGDHFTKFHTKQGLVLFSLEVILWIIAPLFFWHLWPLARLIHVALVILSVIGIFNVVNKKEKMLPVVGQWSKYFTF